MSPTYAERMKMVQPSIIREFAKLSTKEDIISFAPGSPAHELFPIEELKTLIPALLDEDGQCALQYADTSGHQGLRQKIVEMMDAMGVTASLENVHILSGSQQGIDLSGRLYLDRGDGVVVERPTYLGALNSYRSYECEFTDVGLNEDGLDLDELAQVLRKSDKNKLIYIIPDYQNPTGRVWSLQNRKDFMSLVNEHELVVVEDAPYRDLRFEGGAIPPVKAFDTEGRVVYLGSFSKTLCPGFRISWACAEPEILEKIYLLKCCGDLQANSFAQAVIDRYLRTVDFDAHIADLAGLYRGRRDAMEGAMKAFFPEEAVYEVPHGGFFYWVSLPEGIDTLELM
jgi:2-aminoadipate transaminase